MHYIKDFHYLGPSIYDVHTEGDQAQVDACGRGEGSASCGRPHKKLEPTDVSLSSSHAKKLAFFYKNFIFGQNKKWKFFIDIN